MLTNKLILSSEHVKLRGEKNDEDVNIYKVRTQQLKLHLITYSTRLTIH